MTLTNYKTEWRNDVAAKESMDSFIANLFKPKPIKYRVMKDISVSGKEGERIVFAKKNEFVIGLGDPINIGGITPAVMRPTATAITIWKEDNPTYTTRIYFDRTQLQEYANEPEKMKDMVMPSTPGKQYKLAKTQYAELISGCKISTPQLAAGDIITEKSRIKNLGGIDGVIFEKGCQTLVLPKSDLEEVKPTITSSITTLIPTNYKPAAIGIFMLLLVFGLLKWQKII